MSSPTKYTAVSGKILKRTIQCPICEGALHVQFRLLKRDYNKFNYWISMSCGGCHHYHERNESPEVFGIETHGYYSDENFIFNNAICSNLRHQKNIKTEEYNRIKKQCKQEQNYLDKEEQRVEDLYFENQKDGLPVYFKTRNFIKILGIIESYCSHNPIQGLRCYYFKFGIEYHLDRKKIREIYIIFEIDPHLKIMQETRIRTKSNSFCMHAGKIVDSEFIIDGYEIVKNIKTLTNAMEKYKKSKKFKLIEWVNNK